MSNITGYNPNLHAAYKAIASSIATNKADVSNMIKFVKGEQITTTPYMSVSETITGSIPILGLWGIFAGGRQLKENHWNIKQTIQNVNNASVYKARSQALSAGKTELVKNFKDVFKKNVAVSADRGFLNHGKLLDKIPGYSKFRATGLGQTIGKTGAGWMAVLDGGIEMFTQVVPAFQQGGVSSGLKQLGKSATKVGLGTVGWIGGDTIGRALGSAIGTFICPGIGTAIGGFIGGFLGGMAGSAIAGNLSHKLTGKSEIEKLNDQQNEQVAEQINNDAQAKAQLALEAYQKAEAALAANPNDKDAQLTKEAAIKALEEYQISMYENQNQAMQQTEPTQQNAYQPAINSTGYQTYYPNIPPVPGFNGFDYDMTQYQNAMANNQTMTTPNFFNNNGQNYWQQQMPYQSLIQPTYLKNAQ